MMFKLSIIFMLISLTLTTAKISPYDLASAFLRLLFWQPRTCSGQGTRCEDTGECCDPLVCLCQSAPGPRRRRQICKDWKCDIHPLLP
uniref:Gsp_28 putative toxin n=1 Tax=Gemmula speciosa TaxID=439592 RepID=A0A098LXT8_GEMSP